MLQRNPEKARASSFLDRGGVSLFTPALDLDSVLGSPVRLIQSRGLSITEYDPVADRVSIWQRRSWYAGSPAIRDET
jgi:hypothetical protein